MTSLIKSATRVLGVALAAGAMAFAASAQQRPDETERNRALVTKGMQAWVDGTGSPYDLLAENARWTITGTSLAAKPNDTSSRHCRHEKEGPGRSWPASAAWALRLPSPRDRLHDLPVHGELAARLHSL